jgi:hypothetical protein
MVSWVTGLILAIVGIFLIAFPHFVSLGSTANRLLYIVGAIIFVIGIIVLILGLVGVIV